MEKPNPANVPVKAGEESTAMSCTTQPSHSTATAAIPTDAPIEPCLPLTRPKPTVLRTEKDVVLGGTHVVVSFPLAQYSLWTELVDGLEPTFRSQCRAQFMEVLFTGSRKVDYGAGVVCIKLGGSLLNPQDRLNEKTQQPYFAWGVDDFSICIICVRTGRKQNSQVLRVESVHDKKSETENLLSPEDDYPYKTTLALYVDRRVRIRVGYKHGKPCKDDEDPNHDDTWRKKINPFAIYQGLAVY